MKIAILVDVDSLFESMVFTRESPYSRAGSAVLLNDKGKHLGHIDIFGYEAGDERASPWINWDNAHRKG